MGVSMTKILLVEDDKSLREIYGVRLIAEGYQIASAGDGEQALAMAVKERPDLIISDVMMPKISGFDMLDILRTTPETKNLKVIMMTALSSEDQRARGEALGADRYLVKSQVGIEDVVRTVHDVLADSPIAAATSTSSFSTMAPSSAVAPQPTSTLPPTPTPEAMPAPEPKPIVLPKPNEVITPSPMPAPTTFVPPMPETIEIPTPTVMATPAPTVEPSPKPFTAPAPMPFVPPMPKPNEVITPSPIPAPTTSVPPKPTQIPVASFFEQKPVSNIPPMPAPGPSDEKIIQPPAQPPMLDISDLINQELNGTSAPTNPAEPIQ
jgi:CheY-like chemotaxis protein